jgi:serine/threonine protein kinase
MRYASAEVALEETTSFKSDIWSLGIVIYEVLTKRRVWETVEK